MNSSIPASALKPYLLRALYEWCADSGWTPQLLVAVDDHTDVPSEFVQDGFIVLNIGNLAVNALVMGQTEITFQARFSGRVREIRVPIARVAAFFARENQQGMEFAVEPSQPASPDSSVAVDPPNSSPNTIRRIK